MESHSAEGCGAYTRMIEGADGAPTSSMPTAAATCSTMVCSKPFSMNRRVAVLDMGADDYLVKPFSFSELSARLRAVLRRKVKGANPTMRYDDLEVNVHERSVKRGGKRIDLTSKEFMLLEFLMRNSGHKVSRAMIVEQVWNLNFDTMTNVVDVYINYLRKKVDDGAERKLIHTVRGVGYQFGSRDVA